MAAIGRKEIFTDEVVINSDNIIPILQKAMRTHMENVDDENFLLNFEAGIQPRKQEKVSRKEIDAITVDNCAHEISKFWRSFFWGQPITLVQRGEADEGKKSKEPEAIALLNECYEAEGVKSKTQKLGRFVEPTGLGYVYIDLKYDYVDGDSYFMYEVLDPRYAFIVKSGYYVDQRPMVGVSYRIDENGGRHYTAITKEYRFEIDELTTITNGAKKSEWSPGQRSGEVNPFGVINIVEYVRSHDRTGVFEHEIDDMIDLNLNESNFSNAVAETVNTIWLTTDVDLKETVTDEDGNTTVEDATPKNGDWLHVYSTQDGKTPKVEPLTIPFDSAGTMNYILAKRALILQKCDVPQRNDNSGGSTGLAMDSATGWSAAEIAASMEQQIVETCKLNELKVVLAVIKKSPYVKAGNPLLKLRYSDCLPNMKRSKQYEISTKINCYATGVSHGIAPEHMIREINFFADPQQVIEDSKPYIERYLKSIYHDGEGSQENVQGGIEQALQKAQGNGNPNDTEKRIMQDRSDQESNSPMMSGKQTEQNR